MHSQDTTDSSPSTCPRNNNNNNNDNNNKNDLSGPNVPLVTADGSNSVCSLEGDLKSKLKLDLQSKRKISTLSSENFHIGNVRVTCTHETNTSPTDDDDDSSRGLDEEEFDEDDDDDDDDLTTGSVSCEGDEYDVDNKKNCQLDSCLSKVPTSPCLPSFQVSKSVETSPMRRCFTLRKSFNQLIAKTAKILLPYHHQRHRSFHRHSPKCYTCSCKVSPCLTKETMSCNLESSSSPFICTLSDTLGVKRTLPMTRVFSDGHFTERLTDDYTTTSTCSVMKGNCNVTSPMSSSTSPTLSEKAHQSIKYCTTVTGNQHKRLLELPDRFDTRLRRKSDSFLLRAKSPVTSDILDSPATCTSCSCSSSTSYFLLVSPKLVDANTFLCALCIHTFFSFPFPRLTFCKLSPCILSAVATLSSLLLSFPLLFSLSPSCALL